MCPLFLLGAVACGLSTNAPGGDGSAGRHHPEGYYDFREHGPDAKLQTEICTSCHGEDLTGDASGVSCDSCHPSDWRTDCTFCHGGEDNETGAPPRDFLGETTRELLSFPPHTAHVTETIHAPFDCTTCHVKPTDILSTGHVFVGDTTAGVADVTLAGGLSSAGTYDGQTCSNLYCHGNGQGDNGVMEKSGDVDGCDDCHSDWTSDSTGWHEMSGHHWRHLTEGLQCYECHSGTLDQNHAIVGPSLHVNGTADLDFTQGMVFTAGHCTGECHDEEHDDRIW